MIDLLIYIVVLCVVFGLVLWILREIPLPAPFGRIAYVVAVVVFAIILIYVLLGMVGTVGVPRLR